MRSYETARLHDVEFAASEDHQRVEGGAPERTPPVARYVVTMLPAKVKIQPVKRHAALP
jgi:hypothetical protein